jgi:hypothetical protein
MRKLHMDFLGDMAGGANRPPTYIKITKQRIKMKKYSEFTNEEDVLNEGLISGFGDSFFA